MDKPLDDEPLSTLFKKGITNTCEPFYKNRQTFEDYRHRVKSALEQINGPLQAAKIDMAFHCSKVKINSKNLRDEFVIFQTSASAKGSKSKQDSPMISIQLDEQKGELFMRMGEQNLSNPATKAESIGSISKVDIEQQINQKIIALIMEKISIPDQMRIYEACYRPEPNNV